MPPQNLSCPDRFRLDNGKTPNDSPLGFFANIQLELPAVAVAGHAPDFEGTEFSDASLEPHRHNVSHLAIEFQGDVQRAAFLDIVTPVFQKAADLVLLTYAGTQETKLGWFADHQSKLSIGYRGFRALLHSKGNDTERLEWSFHARHCWHGAFNSDV